MKDSQIGSYGTLTLILVTGLRWSAIATILASAPAAIIASTALSRATMPLAMNRLAPARSEGLSQGVGQPAVPITFVAIVVGLAIAFRAVGTAACIALLCCLIVTGGCIILARNKINGQPGDAISATQQLCEIAALCLFATIST